MAKTSSTVNLENQTWDEIKAYMKANQLNSRNTAIEWMLLERRTLMAQKVVTTVIEEPRQVTNQQAINYHEPEMDQEDEFLDELISDIQSGMPE